MYINFVNNATVEVGVHEAEGERGYVGRPGALRGNRSAEKHAAGPLWNCATRQVYESLIGQKFGEGSPLHYPFGCLGFEQKRVPVRQYLKKGPGTVSYGFRTNVLAQSHMNSLESPVSLITAHGKVNFIIIKKDYWLYFGSSMRTNHLNIRFLTKKLGKNRKNNWKILGRGNPLFFQLGYVGAYGVPISTSKTCGSSPRRKKL